MYGGGLGLELTRHFVHTPLFPIIRYCSLQDQILALWRQCTRVERVLKICTRSKSSCYVLSIVCLLYLKDADNVRVPGT